MRLRPPSRPFLPLAEGKPLQSPTQSYVEQEKKLDLLSYLEVILDATIHMLQTVQSIKSDRDECTQLARMAAALALAIKADIDHDPTLFGVNGSKLGPLSSLLEKMDEFIARINTFPRLKRFKNRQAIRQDIARFEENLDEEAKRLEVSPESGLARWLRLREELNISDKAYLWPDIGQKHSYINDRQDTSHRIIKLAASEGILDLSRAVQILGKVPAARGLNTLIWPGMLNGNYKVAVKYRLRGRTEMYELAEEFIRDFLGETLTWFSATHHENVLPLLGVARVHNTVALISPWMEEGSLGAYVKTHPGANVEELLADVSRGLAYLHTKNIVYGNLLMSTVLVSGTGRAYLSSFLAAQSVQPGRLLTVMPESDVFAFGNLLIKVLANRSELDSDVLQHILYSSGRESSQRPHSVQGLGDELWGIVQSCWAIEAADRPTMADVARRMVSLSEALISTSPIPPRATESSRPLKDISVEVKKLSEHPIASGGHSDIYLGERLGSEKVALKLVRFFRSVGPDMDATRRRFRSEASLWAELRHPRILEFYGICNHGTEAFFMVTPFLENGTILDYLSTVDPDGDRVSLLSQAAEGLLYLHTREPPVVHGDMKASNILITDARTAVLADFGLAKLSHELTTTMLQGVGSPRWMAPELVVLGDNVAGPVKTQKSDVYAYGHVILEVLSDKLPFFHLKEDVHVIIELIRKGRSSRPDGPVADRWLNDSAWEFSRDCTAVNPDERPTIDRLVSQLHRLRE